MAISKEEPWLFFSRLKLSDMSVTFDLFWSGTCDETSAKPLCEYTPYRSSNGTCNNLENPDWGATFSPFRRLAPPSYGDGGCVCFLE